MKVIEILSLNKELLLKMKKLGIRMNDVQYVELYDQYCNMINDGNKVSYVIAKLAEEYSVSERKVYDLVRRFNGTLQLSCSVNGGGKTLIYNSFSTFVALKNYCNEKTVSFSPAAVCRAKTHVCQGVHKSA